MSTRIDQHFTTNAVHGRESDPACRRGDQTGLREPIRIASALLLILLILAATGCDVTAPRSHFVILAEPSFGYAPLRVEFSCETGTSEMNRWQWNLGEGDNATTSAVTRTYEAGTHTISLIAWDGLGRRYEDDTRIYVRPELSGIWEGALLLGADDDRPSGIELDLEYENGEIRGTVEYGLYSVNDEGDIITVEMPIVVGRATFDSIYIHAEGNSRPPVTFHRLILEGLPGEILSGTATTYRGETLNWVARRP